jgi:hypothetical protein
MVGLTPPGHFHPPVPTEWEAREHPEPVWTLWSRGKSHAPTEDRTPTAYPITRLVAIPTELFRLPCLNLVCYLYASFYVVKITVYELLILSCVGVTIDGVWIGEWIS